MKKAKGQTVDLLYTNKKETNKKTKSKMKKTTKTKNTRTKKDKNNSNEIINLDNEIIIGLTPKVEEPKSKKNAKKTKKNNKKPNNVKINNKKNTKKNKQTNKKDIKSKNKKNSKTTKKPKKKRNLKFIKWIIVFVLFITAVILFMMSSIFNIKQIEVINNSKVDSQEIIVLSKLTPGVNMFKTTNRVIRNNVKENAYIEEVKVKRNINGTITLDIKERIPTYMLKFANAYVYINNQGYMLETSETPLEIPVITGFTTPSEEFKPGNRLNVDDLSKLDDVIKIMEASKNSSLANTITEIDITNSFNYKLAIGSEEKTIQFGDLKNINIKLQMAGQVMAMEKGKKGEIYFQDDSKKAVFKEQVSR